MADSARQTHVSPGIYSREIDLTYAVKSLGITTLGLVGETLRGPAFQPILIENWRDFQDVFGGTSTEKFVESQYPKYELPYIAKSYLSESNQLQVCRVLGLSGYNAGPAWAITASVGGDSEKSVVAVLRSRGSYKKIYKTSSSEGDCVCPSQAYDTLIYDVGEIESENCDKPIDYNLGALSIEEFIPLDSNGDACSNYTLLGGQGTFSVTSLNQGRFRLVGFTGTNPRGLTTEYQQYTTSDGAVGYVKSIDDFKVNVTSASTNQITVDEGEGDKFMNGGTYVLTYNNKSEQFKVTAATTSTVDFDKELSAITFTSGELQVSSVDVFTDFSSKASKILSTEEISSIKEIDGYFDYAVSLNPNDNEYILKVLGTTPFNGNSPIYVESLYDVALAQKINKGLVDRIDDKLTGYQVFYKADYCGLADIYDFISKGENILSRKDIGKRFLADADAVKQKITCHPFDKNTRKPIFPVLKEDTSTGDTNPKYIVVKSDSIYKYYTLSKEGDTYEENVLQNNMTSYDEPVMTYVELGYIYTVTQYTDKNGKRHYYYRYYDVDVTEESTNADLTYIDRLNASYDGADEHVMQKTRLVKNSADGKYYRIFGEEGSKDIYPVTCDMNDYRDAYRFASTPWIVSNVKGDVGKIELTRLFRFHTISDGDNSNNEIKISIQNIKLDDGTFDVVVRDINDTDDYLIILEKFSKCTLKPGDNNFIAYKIGSYDGIYESKSKYITVEVNENITSKNSIPAGFMGYPLTRFNGLQVLGQDNIDSKVSAPTIEYNLNYDNTIKNRKQYFGLSNLTGIDIDMFTYKGKSAYSQEPEYLSQGFHLDSRLDMNSYMVSDNVAKTPKITVDGVEGYKFDAVSTNNRTNLLNNTPIIGTETEMEGSIYENVDLRKFTVYFYGGFDGWDVYRGYRSNTDDFHINNYDGVYDELSGEGYSFSQLKDSSSLKLNQVGITSDWYAYLSGIRQFSNPEEVDINVFATPGIDIINNTLLIEETIDMLENERADSIYVATLPDKPFGAKDYLDEMYTPEDVVAELEDTEINSNYACTYYPWVKYEDTDNNQYIYLPPTKDVVRNMALTDNTTYPWFAPAGIDRGDVNCVKAHFITKLSDEDTLYEGRINPVKTFASDGVKIWGQKNLQTQESQLNRIAVRRLLLRMRKLIAIACIGLIFEPNDSTTKNKFLSTITPILDNIKSNRGISDYRIEVNDTLESRERRELPAKIYFKPYNALEYITLDFILTPEGASFDAI